ERLRRAHGNHVVAELVIQRQGEGPRRTLHLVAEKRDQTGATPMDQVPATSFEASDVISMFPTLAWKLQLNPTARDSIETEVLGLLETLRRGRPPLRAGEGWQSEQNLHRRQEMRDLTAHIDQAARGILRFLHIGYDAFEITGCWLNV